MVRDDKDDYVAGPLIDVERLSKVYDTTAEPVVALQQLDLTIDRRQFVSIMGPSGSGKTTLLHILGGLERPSSGLYMLEGVDVAALKDPQLARIRRDHFGFVFQNDCLFDERTIAQNVEVPMIYAGIPARDRRRRVEELLARVGLEHRMRHRPGELSGGEQQRAAIARALANSPTILFADEPTGHLPSEEGRQVMELLQELNESGMTVIVVTHDPVVAAWSERLFVLRDGMIIADDDTGTSQFLKAQAALWGL